MKKYLLLTLIACVCTHKAAAQSLDIYLPQWLKIDSLFLNHHGTTALKDLDKLRLQAEKDNNIGQQIKILLFQIVKDTQNTEGVVTAIQRLEQAEQKAQSPVKAVLQSLLGELYASYAILKVDVYGSKQPIYAKGDMRSLNRNQLLDKALAYYQASLKDEMAKNLPIATLNTLTMPNYTPEDVFRPTIYDFLAHRALDFCLNQWKENLTERYGTSNYLMSDILFTPTDIFLKQPFETSKTLSPRHLFMLQTFQNLLHFHQKDPNKAAFLEVERRRFAIFNVKDLSFYNEYAYESSLENLVQSHEDAPSVISLVDALVQHYIYKGEQFKTSSYYDKSVNLENRFYLKKAYDLCTRTLAQHPTAYRRELLEQHIKHLKIQALKVESEAVVLPEKPILFKVSFKNVDTVYCRWVKVSVDDSIVRFFNQRYVNDNIKLYQNIVRNETVALPSIQDFQMHETEVIADGLPLGHYVLLVSNDAKFDENTEGSFVFAQKLAVSALAISDNHFNGLTVVHRETGKPLKNVTLTYYKSLLDKATSKSSSLLTNKDGQVETDYLESNILVLGNDTLNLGTAHKYDRDEKHRLKVHFFTDRNIYRPAQTIQFKGILIDEKQKGQPKIWKHQQMKVIFSKENDEDTPIDTLSVTTNEFGAFSGSFKAPTGGELGVFQLFAAPFFNNEDKEEKFEDEYDVNDRDIRQIIRIEEYKRPRFELVVTPQNRTYKIGDTVLVKGRAMSLAGSAVDGIQVRSRGFQRVTNSYAKPNYKGSGFNSRLNHNMEPDTIRTDKNGGFTFSFVARHHPDDSANILDFYFDYQYFLEINAVDVTGESQQARTSVMVGGTSLQFDLPTNEYVQRTNKLAIPLPIFNKNNPQEAVLGSIRIEKITPNLSFYPERYWSAPDTFMYDKKFFHQQLPEMDYLFEKNKKTQDDTTIIYAATFNNGLEKEKILRGCNQWQVGRYRMTFTAYDTYLKDSISRTLTFDLLDFDKKELPASNDLTVYTDKTTYFVGESVKMLIKAPYTEGFALVEFLRNRENIQTQWLPVQNGVVSAHYTIRELDRGTLSYHISMIKNNRVYTAKKDIYITSQDKKLNIEVTTFRDHLQPNENETWTFRITDNRNKAANAEMVATLYDASLDLLKDNRQLDWDRPIYEASYYNNTRETDWTGFKRTESLRINKDIVFKGFKTPDLDFLNKNPRSFHWFSLQGYTYTDKDLMDYFMGDEAAKASIWQLRGSVYYEEGQYIRPKFVILSDSTALLDGVLVVGYATMKKSNMTGSVSSFTVTNLNESRAASGVFGGGKLQIRGSRSADTNYYLDGAMLQGNIAGVQIDNESSLSEVVVVGYGTLKKVQKTDAANLETIKARSNLNETAFFFPHLTTDADGKVSINFTMNENLTRWNFLAWAHTQDLKTGYLMKTAVSQKELMVFPNMPRFLREGDEIELVAKVSNLKKEASILRGQIQLKLFDTRTMQPIDNECGMNKPIVDWSANNGQSAVAKWRIKVPSADKYSAITWRVVAQGDNLSDGEENTIPILSNRILLTKTFPFTLNPKNTEGSSFTANFSNLDNLDTPNVTMQPLSWSAQIVTNPIWNAVTALRYAKTYPHECTEQLFSRFYSNTLAHQILKDNPTIKAFLSRKQTTNKENRAENAAIRQLLQEESPWLFASEGFDVDKLSQLFDTTFMALEQNRALEKLLTRTTANGGLSWYPEGEPSPFITQHIVAGFGHLSRLGLSFDKNTAIQSLLQKAIGYLDNQIIAFYTPNSRILRRDTSLLIHALYTRSFYPKIQTPNDLKKAIDTTTTWLKHHWLSLKRYEKTLAALTMHRLGEKTLAKQMVASIKSEKEPTFWTSRNYYYWNEMPVETKALMIEMYDEITNDTPSVNRLKQDLLSSLEDGHWYSTKATTEAVYVLLHCGKPQGAVKNDVVQIKTASPILQQQIVEESQKENFIHLNLKGKDITKALNGTTFTNNGTWILNGNVTFKYFENIDKVKAFGNDSLNVLAKHLFKINNTKDGEKLDSLTEKTPLSIGDRLRVRLKIHIGKALEYTHLKDTRPSNCEPVDVLSERKYYPISCYKTTRDVSTNFFFDYLPRGDYELTYDMMIQQRGIIANGVASLECMYAPNIGLHTEGSRLKVE